jgi:hypothetical protein
LAQYHYENIVFMAWIRQGWNWVEKHWMWHWLGTQCPTTFRMKMRTSFLPKYILHPHSYAAAAAKSPDKPSLGLFSLGSQGASSLKTQTNELTNQPTNQPTKSTYRHTFKIQETECFSAPHGTVYLTYGIPGIPPGNIPHRKNVSNMITDGGPNPWIFF